MTENANSAPPTIFLYTEEKRGNQLVESVVIGQISDFSGSEKLIVVQDPHTRINFVYRIDAFSNNLDAVSITHCAEADFAARKNITIRGATFKLGPPSDAIKLLRGKNQWIQDKGSILSVLLQGAATNTKSVGMVRTQIQRERLDRIPPGVQVEYLRDRAREVEAPPAGEDPAVS
ncbi:hypothetical protein [Achromobacter aloeverae]